LHRSHNTGLTYGILSLRGSGSAARDRLIIGQPRTPMMPLADEGVSHVTTHT